MIKTIKKYHFYPLLLGLFPVLFIYSNNISQLSFIRDVIPSLFVVLVINLVFISISFALFKDRPKAFLMSAVFIIFFFTFGYLTVSTSWTFSIGSIVVGPNKIKFVIWIVGTVLLGMYINRRDNISDNLIGSINISALTLVLISIFSIFQYLFSNPSLLNEAKLSDDHEVVTTLSESPDVYYIIFDEYAGKNALLREFKFDNSSFYDELRERNFHVIDGSFSNYSQTVLSLGSSLNVRYLDDFVEQSGPNKDDWSPAYDLVENSKIVRDFKNLGYKFFTFRSGYYPTNFNKNADLNFQKGLLNEFATTLAYTTMLNPFMDKVVENNKRERTLYALDTTPTIAKNPDPTFTFVHIIAPHQPYAFGPNGESVSGVYGDLRASNLDKDEGGVWTDVRKELYIGEIQYLNKRVVNIIDEIIDTSDILPVIIVQSDHGSKSNGHLDNISDALYIERMEILNAILLPDHIESAKSIKTPVNTFRVIFNNYFGSDYDLLPDRMYYSTLERPFDFKDVTDLVTSSI